jgi:hypothetical protein
MDLKALWRRCLNEWMTWGQFDPEGTGWVYIHHDAPVVLGSRRVAYGVTRGRVVHVKDLSDLSEAELPTPAMIKSPAEGFASIEALPGGLPLLDGLRLLRPSPVAPEGAGHQVLSFPDRIVEVFLRRVEAEDPILAARLPEEDLRKAARSRMTQGVAGKLLECLDTNVLDALAWSAIPTNQERVLDWFGVWRRAPLPSEEILKRRRQALEAAPFFAGVIPALRQAREAVDEGRPLLPALAETFGISASQAAAIAGLRMPRIVSSGMSFRDQVQVLAKLPPDWLRGTRTEPEARALARLLILERQAEECGCPPGVFTGKSGGKWLDALQRLAKAGMDRRPPEGITEDGYKLLKSGMPLDEVAQAAPRHRRTVARFHAARFAELVGGVTTEDVADWAARVAAPDTGLPNLFHGLGMLRDMARSYAYKILLPLVLQDTGMSGRRLSWDFRMELERAASSLLFNRKSGARLFEMARSYTNAEPRLVGEDVDEAHAKEMAKLPSPEEWTLPGDQARRFGVARMAGPSWPMIAKPVIAPNGLALVPLTCQMHLQDEGRGWNGENLNEDGSQGLSICVGTHGYYLANCLSGKNQIISVRIPSDDGRPVRRLSCVQLEIKSLNEFKNVQHRGIRNCTPAMEAQDAIAWWLANIGTERIPVNPFWQDFAKKGGILKSDNSDESRILCGYDWKKLEKLHAANAIWKDVFGNEIPDVSVAREHEDIKRIVSENSIEFSLCP